MQVLQAQQAYDEIVAQIKQQGGTYRSWYCGIAANWSSRLFDDHKVPRKDSWYIARQCNNNQSARNVEDALHKVGCDGGPGGGSADTIYVYAYLKTTTTSP